MRTTGGRNIVRRRIAPFGTWPSPVAAADVGANSLRLGMLQGAGPWVYWSEGRPAEGGRVTLMRARSSGRPEELLSEPYSARSRVHEYGGGEFLVAADRIFFVNDADQQIYETAPGRTPHRVTDMPGTRFADMAFDERRNRLIAVAEQHGPGDSAPRNLIVAVALDRQALGQVQELARDADFYAYPRLSPDGALLAFISWMLPEMPWEEAQLWVSEVLEGGRIGKPRRIAGGRGASVCEPTWAAPQAGGGGPTLIFLSDRTGYDNLYAWEPGKRVRALCPREADFGRPLWSLGTKSYAVLASGIVGASYLERGEARFGLIDLARGGLSPLDIPVRSADQVVVHGEAFAALVHRDSAPPAIADLPLKAGPPKVIRSASPISLAKGSISRGRVIELRTGAAGDPVYALFYPPANALWQAPKDTLPPAIVLAHGGPTGAADRGLKLKTQFWTSRGFAMLDVDYSGSTGYGRDYRRRLDGKWGLRDVEDLVAAGDHLEREGLADGRRLVLSGSSAGGYSVLMTLASSRRFAAGSCSYGICDLRLLLAHTHKFESGYLHRLMGTTPDRWEEVLRQRSPLTLADGITAPLILFQGLADKVVPPEQTRLIFERLLRSGVPTECWEFDGEGHGFRRAGTIATVLERELAFLTRVLKLANGH